MPPESARRRRFEGWCRVPRSPGRGMRKPLDHGMGTPWPRRFGAASLVDGLAAGAHGSCRRRLFSPSIYTRRSTVGERRAGRRAQTGAGLRRDHGPEQLTLLRRRLHRARTRVRLCNEGGRSRRGARDGQDRVPWAATGSDCRRPRPRLDRGRKRRVRSERPAPFATSRCASAYRTVA